MANKKRNLSPKTVLKLPDLEQSKSAVLSSLTSRSSQRSYDHAIREFINWYCSEPRLAFNKTVVTRYRINLEQTQYASSTINLRLAAIRRLAYEAADCGLLSPDLAAGIRRVKGVKKHGMRIGNWLTADQGKRLLAAFGGTDLRARRDYAICGSSWLRPQEGGGSRYGGRRSPTARGALGNRGPHRQRRPRANCAYPDLGQGCGGLADRRWHLNRPDLSGDQ
jgi:hypothetical protein